MMNKIYKYLDSLELKNEIQSESISYLDEIELFCNRNRNILSNLPSTGQFEQMKSKRNPKDLLEYIKHQSEKSTNKSWKTKIKYENQNKKLDIMFYEFLIYKIYEIYKKCNKTVVEKIDDNKKDSDKFKLMVNYYIEYLSDHIKMSRRR